MQIRARFGQIPLILSFFQIIRFIFVPCTSTKFTPNAGDIWFGILGFQQCWLADLKCFLTGFCTEKYLSLIIRYDSNIIKSKQRKEPSANRASLVHQTWVSSSCMFFCWYFCLLSCKTSFSRYRSAFVLYKRQVSSCKYFRVPLSEPLSDIRLQEIVHEIALKCFFPIYFSKVDNLRLQYRSVLPL